MQTKDNNFGKKRLIYDIILVLALAVIGLAALLIVKLTARGGESVVVKQNGEIIAELSLDASGVYPLADGKNILVIEGGEAFMSSADCPDKLCVNQGRISNSGESIICLPNKLSVTVQ